MKLSLFLILGFLLASPKGGAQNIRTFKDASALECHLYWAKGIELIEAQRYNDFEKLLKSIVHPNLEKEVIQNFGCRYFQKQYTDLLQSLSSNNEGEIEKAFLDFVLTGIYLDLHNTLTLSDSQEKSRHIKGLFKEVIAIQKLMKKYEFENYKRLILLFRQINQVRESNTLMARRLDQLDELQMCLNNC